MLQKDYGNIFDDLENSSFETSPQGRGRLEDVENTDASLGKQQFFKYHDQQYTNSESASAPGHLSSANDGLEKWRKGSKQSECEEKNNDDDANTVYSAIASATSSSPASPVPKRGFVRENNDSDEERESKRNPNRKDSCINKRPFACPFWKLNPAKYHDCFNKKLHKIRRVKQHLVRIHMPEFYCDCCLRVFLTEQEKLTRWENKTTSCVFDKSRTFNGVTYGQRIKLSRKSKPHLSDSEQWFAIWHIVFPDRQKPSSPYIDQGLSEDLCQFREFSENRVPALFIEELQTQGLVVQGNEIVPLLQGAINRIQSAIFEEWLASRPTAWRPSGSSRSFESVSQQQTLAMPGSRSDGGVGVAFQRSSSRSGENAGNSRSAFERGILDPGQLLETENQTDYSLVLDSTQSAHQNFPQDLGGFSSSIAGPFNYSTRDAWSDSPNEFFGFEITDPNASDL
jgi:hypothetical protein